MAAEHVVAGHPYDLLIEAIERDPAAPRLGDSETVLTGRQTLDLINALTMWITRELGAEERQVGIAIHLPRNRFYLASMFAAWQAGHYFIPLNDRWPDDHLRSIVARAEPRLVISPEVVADLGAAAPTDADRRAWRLARQAARLAYVIFTSGSTGEQKGVMISHHGYRAYREWARSYFSVPKGPHALLITAELTFDITMGDLAFALAHDVQIHVSPDPRNIMWHAKLIRDRRIDMFYSVPSTIRRLYAWAKDRADVDLRRLRWVVSGGEAFSPDLIDLVRSLSPMAEFHNVYGPTEVTINCMATRVDHLRERIAASGNLVPIGLPFPHLKTLLYDATTGRPAETMGELLVAGAQCMDGYYGDPERTTAAFLEVDGVRYYRTGDLVRRDPDGYHVVLGRIDDLVKVKGYRINPLEIDHVLAGDARVKEVKTVVFREGESPQPVVSFVVPVPAQRGVGLSDLLIERCRARLPEYMVPQAIVELDQLPCGSSGKYDANHLKRIWLEQQVTHATVSPS